MFRIGHIGCYDVLDIDIPDRGRDVARRAWSEIERGVATARALEAHHDAARADRPRVLVRESIADAGLELRDRSTSSRT